MDTITITVRGFPRQGAICGSLLTGGGGLCGHEGYCQHKLEGGST